MSRAAHRGARASRGLWLSVGATCALVAYLFLPVLSCPDRCIVDPIALRGPGLGHIELPDVHLNAWILAWVQHALVTDPLHLFDANAFHPTRGALTQSEHMLAIALWTFPLRLFSGSAVWLHQAALIGSGLMLALFTGTLVRWLTASVAAGFAAGAIALWMPWRFTELSHVQLVNAQWFPLVWLFIGRVVETPERRGPALALSLVLALQLLSSFYLSYFLLLSCAGLLLGLWIVERPGSRVWRRLLAAAAPPFALLLAVAIPYLRWSRAQGFQAVDPLFDSVPPADVLSLTLPPLPRILQGLPFETSFAVPLSAALLAGIALLSPGHARDAAAPDPAAPPRARRRAFAIGLALACVGAYVLAHGRRLALGDLELPLPGALAAALVPGFENLRNPLRFAIVIGVAAPVLAGLGFARLESLAPAGAGRRALHAGLLALLALDLATPPLPRRDAVEDYASRAPAWRALAGLPRGALVEVPWPLQQEHDAIHAGRAMLGSTLHWQPLLNGHSGYVPRSYPLLRQVGQELPRAEGLERMLALVKLRWILVHDTDLPRVERRAWDEAAAAGRLRQVFAGGGARVLEVVDWRRGGRYEEVLARPGARATTLAGHPRAPLPPAQAAGRLSLEIAGDFHYAGRRRIPKPVSVLVENRSRRVWPGLDPDPEGLVRLRYAFVDELGREVLRDGSALAADVPPGAQRLRVPIAPPARSGRFRLRAELVQRIDGEDRPLAVEPVEREVVVSDVLRVSGSQSVRRAIPTTWAPWRASGPV